MGNIFEECTVNYYYTRYNRVIVYKMNYKGIYEFLLIFNDLEGLSIHNCSPQGLQLVSLPIPCINITDMWITWTDVTSYKKQYSYKILSVWR